MSDPNRKSRRPKPAPLVFPPEITSSNSADIPPPTPGTKSAPVQAPYASTSAPPLSPNVTKLRNAVAGPSPLAQTSELNNEKNSIAIKPAKETPQLTDVFQFPPLEPNSSKTTKMSIEAAEYKPMSPGGSGLNSPLSQTCDSPLVGDDIGKGLKAGLIYKPLTPTGVLLTPTSVSPRCANDGSSAFPLFAMGKEEVEAATAETVEKEDDKNSTTPSAPYESDVEDEASLSSASALRAEQQEDGSGIDESARPHCIHKILPIGLQKDYKKANVIDCLMRLAGDETVVGRTLRVLLENTSKVWVPYQMTGILHLNAEVLPEPPIVPRRLHVGNIPFHYRDPELRWLAEYYGTVNDTQVVFGREGPKGYGFVTYKFDQDADFALACLNGFTVEKRILVVRYAVLKPARWEKVWASMVINLKRATEQNNNKAITAERFGYILLDSLSYREDGNFRF